jgi:hypothetical protein
VRVMLEWFGRRQTIALPINSVVGYLIATILLMILSENNVRTLTKELPAAESRSDRDDKLSGGRFAGPASSATICADP